MRLAVCASHPIQYQAPMFRALAKEIDLTVLFASKANPSEPTEGFSVDWEWDVDLLSGYEHRFLRNVAARPGVTHFSGCDTPEVGEVLRRGGFDAVLLLGWHLKTFHQALYAAKWARIPVLQRGDSHLGTPRGLAKRVAKAMIYPVFLRLFDAALAVGQQSRAYWRHYGFPESRIFFAPHGVDATWFEERATAEARRELRDQLDIADDERVILFAGKLTEKKRPLDLIAATHAMGEAGRPARILIAGSGPLENEMMAQATTLGIKLDTLGFCNQSRMPAAYAASDLMVLPSENETWGLVANEALACGVPIVLADSVGAAPDLVGDRRVGRSFPVGDVAALAVSMIEILDRPPSLDDIRAKSHAYSVDVAAAGIREAVRVLSASGNQIARR